MVQKLKQRREFFDSSLEKNPLQVDGRVFNYACPCCGYPALSVKAGYDYCFICGWEDDGQDDDTGINRKSSPNHGITLSEARKNFEKEHRSYLHTKEKKVFVELREHIIDLFESLKNIKDINKEKNIIDSLNKSYKKYKRLLSLIKSQKDYNLLED